MEQKPVKKRKADLTFWEKIYIPEILKGLLLTLKNMIRPKFTLEHKPHATQRSSPFSSSTKTGLPLYALEGMNFSSGYSKVNFDGIISYLF